MELSDDELGILGMGWSGIGDNLNQRHSGSVVVDENLVALID